MSDSYLLQLHAAIAAVCPIHGVSLDGQIWFKDEATPEQQEEAQQVFESFVPEEEPSSEPIEITLGKLEGKLRNTPFWAHIWGAMVSNVRANGCASFLLIALTTTRNAEDLVFGFNQLRLALQTEPGLSDFSPAHIDFLATSLSEIDLSLPGLNLTVSES